MKTLIELYDERPIENVLACDVFKPERVIYLCESDIAQNRTVQRKLREFLSRRDRDVEVEFLETSRYYTGKIVDQLEKILDRYDDCAIDISGGSDNMLFAAGYVSGKRETSVLTYSHQKNMFFNISNAEFAEGLECSNLYSISDYIEMAGGKADTGRVEDESLKAHLEYVEPLFRVFLKYRTRWNRVIEWIQHATRNDSLSCVNASYTQKGEKGRSVSCPADCLRDLEKAGLILNLKTDDRISFDFPDSQIRFWLRDVGSALEVFTYKKAIDSGMFDDCKCSVIVEWESEDERKTVSNEIDVMAVQGVTPYFVSCKACRVDTYALNELQILRDRFGGEGAIAAIVTSEPCSAATKKRAEALDITVIEIDELKRALEDG